MKFQFFQDLIDRIRHKVYCSDIFLLNEYNINHAGNFESLILGSSHLYSFIPKSNELNVALPSQDLYYSYMFYDMLNHKNLKNVIISFSVFSPAYCLAKTKDTKMCVLYKVSSGIDYEYPELFSNKSVKNMEKYFDSSLAHLRNKFSVKNAEKREAHLLTDENLIKERALKHFKNCTRDKDEMFWFNKLLEQTSKRNQNLLVVLPPAKSVYKQAIPNSDVIFAKLYNAIKGFDNVKIFNLYDSNIFKDDDFMDADHLKKVFWNEFSDLIRNELKDF